MHFIASFFIEAFKLLGGSTHEREPKRYEVKHVPAVIRNRDWQIGRGQPVLPHYERIAFEKSLISVRLVKWRHFDEARWLLEAIAAVPLLAGEFQEFYYINLAQVSVHEGTEIPSEILEHITAMAETSSSHMSKFGANAVLRRDSNAIAALRMHIEGGNKLTSSMLNWPICELLGEEARRELAEIVRGNCTS